MTDLDALESILAAATQGEWYAEFTTTTVWVGTAKGTPPYQKCDDVFFGMDLAGYKPEHVAVVSANALLIAALHNAAPDLIAAARRVKVLEEALAEAQAERDLAEEAENAAKDVFWAVYPTYIEKHGHGISKEDVERMQRKNETRPLTADEQKALADSLWDSVDVVVNP